MEKSLYLLNLTISGIKNIEKEVKLEFYKKSIDRNFDPSKYRIKAIYGENGSGKTGIVNAVQILQNLLLDDRYLNDSMNQRLLRSLINKRTCRLHIECEFAHINTEKITLYRYSFVLAQNKAGQYVITDEQMQTRSGMYTASKYNTVFRCENGALTELDANTELKDVAFRVTANLLNTSSFMILCILHRKELPFTDGGRKLQISLLALLQFATTLRVSIEQSDNHDLFVLIDGLMGDYYEHDSERTWDIIQSNIRGIAGIDRRIVHKSRFDEYKSDVSRLCKFLKLFKSDLVSVEIEKREERDYYECSLVMDYADYKVDLEFESNGIKKLVRIFRALDAAVTSDIVFIDEMDSNINDIYLCKIVEYFMLYGKGQLCFTTHNTSPMSILKKNKNSIDFISNDNKLVAWKTNGNFAPDSLYQNGMIKYLPFNIEPEDFLGVLGE